jgi:hypothetical protein
VAISPFTKLAAAAAASAQAMGNYRLSLIGKQLTANLNKRINQLKDQSNDPTIPPMQQQAAALATQKQSYDAARSQFSANSNVLSDLTLQLSNLALAAQSGDAAKFDETLGAANTDVGILQVVSYLAGFQPDGVAKLKYDGLAIQSSAKYDLSTQAGRDQAKSDVQAASDLVKQIFAQTTQNQQIASSIGQAITNQITALNTQISNKQQSQLTAAAAEIDKLKKQTQTQYHLIELAFGNVTQASSILSSFQTSGNNAPTPGSVVSLLDTQSGSPGLAVANVAPVSKVSTHA